MSRLGVRRGSVSIVHRERRTPHRSLPNRAVENPSRPESSGRPVPAPLRLTVHSRPSAPWATFGPPLRDHRSTFHRLSLAPRCPLAILLVDAISLDRPRSPGENQ